MKNLILVLTLFFTSVVFGDTKISQLPVGAASTVNLNDSFPYVDSVHGITKRILLGDIQNLPTLQGAFILTQPIPANYVLAGPASGADASPTSRLLVGADLPNPGASSKGGVKSYSSVSHQWINQIATDGSISSSQPAFTDISGTAQPSQGGTGQTSLANAYVALYETIATAVGDLVYGGTSGTPTRLAGNITTTAKFLSQTGTGSVSQAPSWIQPACSNLSDSAASCSTDTTNASNISSGTLGAARLPNPTSSTLGGIRSYAAVSNQWINTISTSGVPSSTQPAFTDISGACTVAQGCVAITSAAVGDLIYGSATNVWSKLTGNITTTKKFLTQTGTGAASQAPSWLQPACGDLSNAASSCSTDTTNASNISSGTLGAARLPNPSATTLGGIESYVAVSHQWINTISTSGVPSSTQPAFTDISGTAVETQGGTNQTTYTLGDILYSSAANTLAKLAGNTTSTKKFLTQTGTGSVSAAPSWVQPACGDLSNSATSCSTDTTNASNISSGTLATARLPAAATFGVAGSSTGSVAVTGVTSGTVTIKPQAAAGTWEFDLPTTAGSAGTVLTSQGGAGTAMTWSTALTNPMTSTGDIIYSSDGSGTPARLAAGTSGQFLKSAGAAAPSWADPSTISRNSSGTTYNSQVVEMATIANNGTCSVSVQSGSWISAIARPGTGRCNITIASGIFSGTPTCVCSAQFSATGGQCTSDGSGTLSNTSWYFTTANSAGTATNTTFQVICMGPQ